MTPARHLLVAGAPILLLAFGARTLALPETTTPVPQDAAEPERQDSADDKGAKRKRPSLAEKRDELEKAQRELIYAEIEVKLARMKSEEDNAKAELDVEGAARAQHAAKRAIASFEAERRVAEARATLAVERAVHRLASSKTDLEGILEIYAEETEASAKGEIIRRHEQQVAFAEHELMIARDDARKTLEFELPIKDADLSWKLEKATAERAHARLVRDRAALAAQLEVLKKEDGEALLQKKVSRLDKEVTKLREARSKKADTDGDGDADGDADDGDGFK